MNTKLIAALLLALAVPSMAFAGRDRCANPHFNMLNGYHILRWAVNCGKGINSTNNIIFNAYLQQANAVTQNGTTFPPEGTPAYENVRDGVNFPAYFAPGSTTDVWQGPNDPAILARIAAQDCSVQIPPQYTDPVFCPSGCYAPNQDILFSENAALDLSTAKMKWLPIVDAFDVKKYVVTLSTEATLDHLSFGVADIDYFITDPRPIRQSLLKFHMASGGELTVTTNHPLVDDHGMMRKARELMVGDSLVRQDGSPDLITSIETVNYFGKVYNLDTKDENPLRKILLANGYLSGSHWYQDLGQSMLNRLLLKSTTASSLED